MVPRPWIAGAGKTATLASGMAANCWVRLAAMALADSSGVLRLSKLSSTSNTAPVLGLLTRPLTFRPGNETVCATPGVFIAISLIRRTTASVRSMVAASGSWMAVTR